MSLTAAMAVGGREVRSGPASPAPPGGDETAGGDERREEEESEGDGDGDEEDGQTSPPESPPTGSTRLL